MTLSRGLDFGFILALQLSASPCSPTYPCIRKTKCESLNCGHEPLMWLKSIGSLPMQVPKLPILLWGLLIIIIVYGAPKPYSNH